MEQWPVAFSVDHLGTTVSRWCGNRRGTSLVELLTATVFVSTLTAMSYTFARAALMSARMQEVKSEAQEVTAMTLDILTHDLRMAGFSAAGTPLTAVRVAESDYVEVASDFNGDGDTADSNELIAYSYNEEGHQLMRATGGGSPQPLARNVPADGVRFSFFDAHGTELVGRRGMTAEERRRIHRIDVALRVQLAHPDPNARMPVTVAMSSSVCLRNQ
jgi:hypothetical protein